MSKYRARTRLIATSSSHALAASAPIRGAAYTIATRTGCALTFDQERCDRLVSIILDAIRV
jgi:hypothetical protein